MFKVCGSTVLALALATTVSATEPRSQFDFLIGSWVLYNETGESVGTSVITNQVPGTMIYEERTVGEKEPQSLWLENAERNEGWTQLFVGPTGMTREFVPQSEAGEWPAVMGANVTLQDGTPVKFRLTITRESDSRSRRILEMSRDEGASWNTVLDYRYVRATPGKRMK